MKNSPILVRKLLPDHCTEITSVLVFFWSVLCLTVSLDNQYRVAYHDDVYNRDQDLRTALIETDGITRLEPGLQFCVILE